MDERFNTVMVEIPWEFYKEMEIMSIRQLKSDPIMNVWDPI
jgi:protein involved in sex pheromone biosynthesis